MPKSFAVDYRNASEHSMPGEPSDDPILRRFLSRAYDFKAVADYEIGPDATLPLAEATAATEAAESYVDRIAELLPSY